MSTSSRHYANTPSAVKTAYLAAVFIRGRKLCSNDRRCHVRGCFAGYWDRLQHSGSFNEHVLTIYRVVFVIMLIATVVFSGLAFSIPVSKRLYHIITTFIVTFAAISYFAMVSKKLGPSSC